MNTVLKKQRHYEIRRTILVNILYLPLIACNILLRVLFINAYISAADLGEGLA